MESSRDRLMYSEVQKMGLLCAELRKSAKLWQDEYLRILQFDGNSEASKKNMRAALEKVYQLLDMQMQQNPQITEAMEEIEAALGLAKRFDLNSVMPPLLLNATASEAAFGWHLEMELGQEMFQMRDGRFEDPAVQARYEGYMTGAKFGFNEAVRLAKLKEVENQT